MSKIVIKRADMNYLKHIQELNNKLFELEFNNFDPALKVGWPFEKDGKEYFEDIIKNHIALVALDCDKVIGYLAGGIHIQSSCVTKTLAEVENIFILEEYRNIGVGRMLIDEFKKYCKTQNIEEIKVTASAKNINAISFYMKNEFEDFEVTLKYKVQ